MSDAELILLILAGFYVVECCHWIRPGSMLLRSQLGEPCPLRIITSAAWLRNDHGGLLLGNLLPCGHALAVGQWPLSLSPAGVATGPCQVLTADGLPDEPQRFMAWEDIKTVATEGSQITINGQPFARAASRVLAGRLQHLLEELRKMPDPAKREAAIVGAVASMLDEQEFARRWNEGLDRTFTLLLCCQVLALYVFGVVPWKLFWAGENFISIVPGYFLLLGLTQLTFWLVHGRLGRPSRERWQHLMVMTISPADAIHARDSLLQELGGSYHPLVVARVLSSPQIIQELARTILLDLRFPLPSSQEPPPPGHADTEKWFRSVVGSALEGYIARSGLDIEQLTRPPEPESAECRSYCPRCHGQYVLTAGACSVCAIRLVPLGSPAPTSWVARPPCSALAAEPPVTCWAETETSNQSAEKTRPGTGKSASRRPKKKKQGQ